MYEPLNPQLGRVACVIEFPIDEDNVLIHSLKYIEYSQILFLHDSFYIYCNKAGIKEVSFKKL